MRTPQPSRLHVIDGQSRHSLTAVLTSMIVPAQDLPFCEFNAWMGTVNHVRQPNDRWPKEGGRGAADYSTTIEHDLSLIHGQQAHRSLGVAHVDRFVIRVEQQNRSFHVIKYSTDVPKGQSSIYPDRRSRHRRT